jgi:hypothetical protein
MAREYLIRTAFRVCASFCGAYVRSILFACEPNSTCFSLVRIPANRTETIFQLNRNRKNHYQTWIRLISFQGKRRELMTKNELKRFQAVLTTRVAELERLIRQRDEITLERTADQLEEIQRASERALAV